MDQQRTTSFAFARSQRRSSIQFGDFPTFEEIQKQSKFGIDRITGARFWFYFRLYLPIYAIGAFVLMFLIPLFLADNDDGFAFYGSLLSLVSCSLVVLSYIHVVPWRRHPSSLMLQISITSLIVSFIVIVKAFPSGKGWLHFNEGGLNLIDANGYSSEGDHTTPCQVMSFFIQLALLAREMWVFSLSMDLVTSITNPFASYRASVRKYHMVIWSMAIASATVLVNQPSCQGQFMADGTCWIRISGSQSPCFWGYFLSWVIAFYLFSVLAMLYAYMRISKGLESTYATRYACVADTFRVVFFYFGYCIVFYFFLSFIYVQPISDGNIKFVESAYAYFISCRGFFDALVWFFSHGFSSSSDLGMREVAGITGIAAGVGGSYDGIVDTSTYAQCSRAQLRRQPTLTMADIVPPKPIVRSMYYTARAACRCVAHLIGCSCGVSLASSKSPSADHTGGPDDDDEHSDHDEEEADDTKPSFSARTHQNHQYNPLPTDPSNTDIIDPENPRSRLTGDMKISDVTARSTRPSGSLWSSSHQQSNISGLSRPSQLSSAIQSTQSTAQSERDKAFQSDIDLSPQLNFALRAELLYLVTMGIKESVLRLDQRELHVLMHHTGSAPAGYSPGNSRSNALHSTQSQSYNQSQSYSFSPNTGRAGPGGAPGAGAGGYPHFTRPSTLRREASQNSLLSENGSGHHYAYGGQGSPVHSPHSSMRVPAGTGAHKPHGQHHNGSFSLTYSHAGSRIQYALRSIQHAVMGTHMPGEYGIDPIVATQEDFLTHRGSQSLNVSPLHTTAHPALSARPSLAPTASRYSLYGPPPPLVKVPSLPPDLRNQPAHAAQEHPVRTSKEEEHEQKDSNNNSLQSDGDLSYGPSNLQEQLLTENVELHQQQYLHIPVAAPAEVVFNLNAKHQFRDFRPATFRKLRQMSGLDESRYLELISQPTKERLSEGASGAFFFYCGEGELVVKTVAKHEANTLLKILDKYITYLQSRPESLLVRFLGLHSISMYGNEFQFVVMKNIFPPNVRMNDKYDIKGSWVNRHATRKDPGKRATCKYCNEYFIEGSVDKCPEVVGGHEAIVTLKDSDMINKIRLYPDHAYALIDILNSDSDALCSMGMMDYSLLVGVKTQQYDIDSLQMSQPPLTSLPDQQRLSSFSDAPIVSDLNSGAGLSASGARNAPITRRSTLAYDNIPFETRENRYSENSDPNNSQSQGNTQSHTNDNTQSTPPEDSFIAAGYPARAVVAPSTYYLGVIDVLQTWSWSKQVEHWFKVYILQQPAAGVSCVPPEEYKQRYQKKMAGIIEHSIFIREVTGSWRGKRQVSEPFPLMRSSEASGVNSLSISTSNTGPFGGSSLGARLSSAGSGALTGILEENNRPSETDASLHSQGSGNTSGNGSGNGINNGAQKQTLKIHTASESAAEGVNLLEAMEDVSPKSDGSCLVSSTPVVLDP